MQKPMTWPPVWRWRLTLPEPSTLRTLIQRPVARSNLKGLNHNRSPCGTQGNSSLCMAWSGRPRSAITRSVCSCVMDLSFTLWRNVLLDRNAEEVRVETDRLLQVGGADADVGEPSRPHAGAPYSGIMETVFHAE